MKFLIFVVFLIFVGHGAVAQTFECSTVPKASDRLACYDRAAPPTAAKLPRPASARSQAAASTSPAAQGQVVDMLAVENSKLDARLKTICRGC